MKCEGAQGVTYDAESQKYSWGRKVCEYFADAPGVKSKPHIHRGIEL